MLFSARGGADIKKLIKTSVDFIDIKEKWLTKLLLLLIYVYASFWKH